MTRSSLVVFDVALSSLVHDYCFDLRFFFAGKFQMQVLPQVGHAVHEDSPEKVHFRNWCGITHFCFEKIKEKHPVNLVFSLFRLLKSWQHS